jgi:5-bromo-4-chloroindolyl phosphate hydrolysis protein
MEECKMYIPGDPKEALKAIDKYLDDPSLTKEDIKILEKALEEVKRRLKG